MCTCNIYIHTALQGVDFTLDESVEFAPEETEKFATIKLLPDSEVEGTETFSVFLVPRSGPVAPNLNHITVVSILDSDSKLSFIVIRFLYVYNTYMYGHLFT